MDRRFFGRVLFLSAVAALGLPAPAQKAADSAIKTRALAGKFPEKPSIAPASTIPVDALGFAAPGALYLGMRNTMASLDFLSEDRLLFTFRIPGLQRRVPGDEAAETARQIRAVVLALPTGAVEAQAQWTLHGRESYLWMLDDGHFLVRDLNSLLEGDETLALKPYLKYPGPLVTVDLNPGQQYVITNSNEPAAAPLKPSDDDNSYDRDEEDESEPENIVLRIVKRSSTQVMMAMRVRKPVLLAANSQGYVGALRGKGDHWTLEMNPYVGSGSKALGDLESSCLPDLEFASEREVLAATCTDNGNSYMQGVTTDGRKLWRDFFPEQTVWPVVKMSPNGLRIARESVFVSHAVAALAPIASEDIKGQWVRVLDAATGEPVLEAPANPILDGGGNMAISPSGRRVALLSANGIQIFELPAPPALPPVPTTDPGQ